MHRIYQSSQPCRRWPNKKARRHVQKKVYQLSLAEKSNFAAHCGYTVLSEKEYALL